MKRKLATACCVALLAIGAVGTAVMQLGSSKENTPDLQDMLGQPKTAMRLHLWGANRDPKSGQSVSGMEQGRDYNAADGKTRLMSRNEYSSGIVEDIHYRSDTTKEWSRDYYPTTVEGAQAVQRSVAWFAKDGKTYIGHEVKRQDGTWERHGELLADGNYRQTYFCKDGKTSQKVQLFDKDKRFISEDAIFCETGKPIRATAPGEYGKSYLTLFTPDGKTSMKLTKTDYYESSGLSGDVYDASGTIKIHFDNQYGEWGGTESYQTLRNGRLEREWSISNGMGGPGNEQIVSFDSSDDQKRKLFEQSWKDIEAYNPSKGKRLLRLTEYQSDGKTKGRDIEFSDKGLPARINMPTSDPKQTLVFILDDTGSKVSKSFMQNSDGSKVEQALPQDKQVSIPAFELKLYTHDAPPKWDDGNTDTGTKLYDFP